MNNVLATSDFGFPKVNETLFNLKLWYVTEHTIKGTASPVVMGCYVVKTDLEICRLIFKSNIPEIEISIVESLKVLHDYCMIV